MEQIHTSVLAFADKANLIWAGVVTGLVAVVGPQWYIFAFFLLLNIVDFYYGRKKARKTGTLTSAKGAEGIGKKVSYWVITALAFALSFILVDLGRQLGVTLDFLMLLGWFTLAVYILNELTSIVENMLVLGYNVPTIFVRGLAVAKTAVDAAGNKIIPGLPKENE